MTTVDEFDRDAPERNFFRLFTIWGPWAQREAVSDGHGYRVHEYPGIYVLAHFDVPPPGPADHRHPEIVYVGEGAWLRRRWLQFERSARLGLDGHSGGHAYRTRFGQREWHRLHVAALPIWFGDAKHRRSAEDWTQAYRLYAERRIIWDLTCARCGTHDLLNRK